MVARRCDGGKERLWRGHIESRQASGLSVRRFCAEQALSASSFYWWRSELARRDAQAATERTPSEPRVALTEVRLIGAPAATQPNSVCDIEPSVGIEVHLCTGRRIGVGRGFDEPTLMRLITLLEGSGRGDPRC